MTKLSFAPRTGCKKFTYKGKKFYVEKSMYRVTACYLRKPLLQVLHLFAKSFNRMGLYFIDKIRNFVVEKHNMDEFCTERRLKNILEKRKYKLIDEHPTTYESTSIVL